MAELADAPDSKSGSLTRVGVRPSLRAPKGNPFDENTGIKVLLSSVIYAILHGKTEGGIDLTGAFTLTIVCALIKG